MRRQGSPLRGRSSDEPPSVGDGEACEPRAFVSTTYCEMLLDERAFRCAKQACKARQSLEHRLLCLGGTLRGPTKTKYLKPSWAAGCRFVAQG